MPVFYSNDPYGRPVLSAINQAQVAQQDADTRRKAAEFQYWLGLQQDQTGRLGINSRERLGNRGYQSEDTRTEAQKASDMFRAQSTRDVGMEANAINRLKAINDAQEAARTDETRRIQIVGSNATAENVATINAAAEDNRAKAYGMQRLRELEERNTALNASGFKAFSELTLAAQEREDAKRQAEADAINGMISQKKSGFFGGGGADPKVEDPLTEARVAAAGGAKKFDIVKGSDGFKRAVPKKEVLSGEDIMRRYQETVHPGSTSTGLRSFMPGTTSVPYNGVPLPGSGFKGGSIGGSPIGMAVDPQASAAANLLVLRAMDPTNAPPTQPDSLEPEQTTAPDDVTNLARLLGLVAPAGSENLSFQLPTEVARAPSSSRGQGMAQMNSQPFLVPRRQPLTSGTPTAQTRAAVATDPLEAIVARDAHYDNRGRIILYDRSGGVSYVDTPVEAKLYLKKGGYTLVPQTPVTVSAPQWLSAPQLQAPGQMASPRTNGLMRLQMLSDQQAAGQAPPQVTRPRLTPPPSTHPRMRTNEAGQILLRHTSLINPKTGKLKLQLAEDAEVARMAIESGQYTLVTE